MTRSSKNNSHIQQIISSKEILRHNLCELRNDLLTFYEIWDRDVLNEDLKQHFPKREKLIKTLIDIKLRELEIKQNGRKLIATVIFAAGAFILSAIQEGRHIIEGFSQESTEDRVVQVQSLSEPNPQETTKQSKLDQTELNE